MKKKTELKLRLQRRLELVRTTIRELTPAQLREANGGYTAVMISYGCTDGCCEYTYCGYTYGG